MPNLIKKGFIVWFTGLPGSGKTTVANSAAEILRSRGFRVEVLDGDWVRRTISVGTGFTKEERRRHLLRFIVSVVWRSVLGGILRGFIRRLFAAKYLISLGLVILMRNLRTQI